MGLFGPSKKEQQLLQLQRLVVPSAPVDRLVFPEKKLIYEAQQLAQRQLKIVNDCTNLINTTIKPEVFFKRYDIAIEKADFLLKLSPFITFRGTPPRDMVRILREKEQPAIKDFLIRYFCAVDAKARSLKTDRARSNQYLKFYESLQPYFSRMNDENKNYIEERKPKS